MTHLGLERQISAALDCAIRSDRLDVAEHLVDALGTLTSDLSPDSALGRAYLSIVESAPSSERPGNQDRCARRRTRGTLRRHRT